VSGVLTGRPLAAFSAWEAVTTLGESAMETALLLRAGLSNVALSDFIDASGERMMMCGAPSLPSHLRATGRAIALAQLALARFAESIDVTDRPALVLAVANRYAGGDKTARLNEEGNSFVAALQSQLPTSLRGCDVEVFPYGRAAGAPALRRAIELADEGRFVIWGGVDTLHDWSVLERLQAADRLLTTENVDGVRPGEGAAFMAVSSGTHRGIRVLGIGTGREPRPIGSEEPFQSLGLSAALEMAVAPLRAVSRRTNCWLLDNSHEAYATKELQNIIARFGDILGLRSEMQMPLQPLGDAGAAAMPLLSVLAAEAWRLGYANDDVAVITGCSDDGARGALLLGAYDGFRPVEMVA
jgi:3-oxoacyl-[acyl-carrier-protein] synthase-1